MKYQTILSFFVLFSMKDILLTQSSRIASILSWVDTKVASKAEIHNAKINIQNAKTNVSDIIKNAFASAENHRMKEHGYPEKITVSPLGKPVGEKCQSSVVKGIESNKINAENSSGSKITYEVNFYTHENDAKKTNPFSLVPRNLSNAEIAVMTENLRITLEVKLRRDTNKPYSEFAFCTTLHFEDFVLNANRTNGGKFVFDISYQCYNAWHHGDKTEMKCLWGELDASSNETDELTKKMVPLLPSLLREHINCNPEFSQAFDKISEIVQKYNIL